MQGWARGWGAAAGAAMSRCAECGATGIANLSCETNMPCGNSSSAYYSGMRGVCLVFVNKKTAHATNPAVAAMRAPSIAIFCA
jgi:hypothetical protein